MRPFLPIRRWPIRSIALFVGIISAGQPSFAVTPQSAPVKQDSAPVEAHFDAAQTFQIAGDLDRAAAEYRKGISVALDRLGNLKVSNGDYDAGLDLLSKAVSADPSNKDVQIDMGIAYFRHGDYANAKASVRGVLKSDPSNFRARNLLGKSDFMLGDFQAAADELQAAMSITPDFDVAYSLALAYLELKKLPQATPLFDEMKVSVGQTPELHALLGRAYKETGFLDLALTEFQEALKLDPAYPHAHSYLGMTYVSMGGRDNYELARQEFRQELTKVPRDYSSRYYVGLIELEEGRLGDAEASLQEAKAINPDDPAPLLLLGRVYTQGQKWPAAIAVLRQAISQLSSAGAPVSQVALAHEMLSKAYVSNGQSKEGADELAAANASKAGETSGSAQDPAKQSTPGKTVEGAHELRDMLMENRQKPRSPDATEQRYVSDVSKLLGNAYNNLGVLDARKGSYADAAEEFKQAAQWDNSIAQLDRNLALAAFRAQLYGDAVDPLERLLRKSPADQNLRQMLALSYYMTNRFKDSAATFRPILNSLPNNPGLLLSAGIAFVKAGDSSSGERMLSRALESGNNTPEVHLMLGQAYAEQADNPQALAEFKHALDLNPKLPEAHYYSGMVFFKRGEMDEAAKQFQSELELNALYVPALYQLAYIRLQQHQAPEATRLLAEVIKQEPANSDAHYQLGKALLEQGDASAATRELETSVQLHPTDYAYFQLSHAYVRTGRDNDARQALENFEKLKPKPATAP
jgi:tetratricopeptide (TPR) repeat protein